MKDSAILLSGRARFTLEGKGLRWTFEIDKSKDENRPRYFAKMLTGADNESDYTYVGLLDPATSRVKATRASRIPEDATPFRGLNYAVHAILADRAPELEKDGFRVVWATTCARCGRTLTVPSSVDHRLGPECAKLINA